MFLAHLWIFWNLFNSFQSDMQLLIIGLGYCYVGHQNQKHVCFQFNRCWKEWFSWCVFESTASHPLNADSVNRVYSGT